MSGTVRVGVVGTSWWADSMYLPALRRHPLADVRAVVGARPEHTRAFAAAWSIPATYDTLAAMLDAEALDAVLVLTPNRLHVPLALEAIARGVHVLCEKPLGMSSREARTLTEAAERAGVITMTPFTYRFMPFMRHVKELVDDGYLGRPYHLNLRYYSGYGRSGEYLWRFDLDEAGAGPSGDLGSHVAYLARWLFGEVTAVTAAFGQALVRPPRADGSGYPQAEDSAMILLEFENGARGSLHVSTLAYEPGPLGQRHALELHGADGTLHAVCDWNLEQRVEGCRAGEAAVHDLPIPDRIFGAARRDSVQDTYKDTFREQDTLARAFITAVASGTPASPDFRDGLAVQRITDAAGLSAREGRRVTVAEIVAGEA